MCLPQGTQERLCSLLRCDLGPAALDLRKPLRPVLWRQRSRAGCGMLPAPGAVWSDRRPLGRQSASGAHLRARPTGRAVPRHRLGPCTAVGAGSRHARCAGAERAASPRLARVPGGWAVSDGSADHQPVGPVGRRRALRYVTAPRASPGRGPQLPLYPHRHPGSSRPCSRACPWHPCPPPIRPAAEEPSPSGVWGIKVSSRSCRPRPSAALKRRVRRSDGTSAGDHPVALTVRPCRKDGMPSTLLPLATKLAKSATSGPLDPYRPCDRTRSRRLLTPTSAARRCFRRADVLQCLPVGPYVSH